ncbi:hypothetical protein P8605_02980 [Streptomyces sp. T-3]|nr:hypothetical protein [Streptomyces sp. T-3]
MRTGPGYFALPVFVLGEGLQTLEPAEFETAAEFQELLARHPAFWTSVG